MSTNYTPFFGFTFLIKTLVGNGPTIFRFQSEKSVTTGFK